MPNPEPASLPGLETLPVNGEKAGSAPLWPVWNSGLVPLPAAQPTQTTRSAAPRCSVKVGAWLAASLEKQWDGYRDELKRCQAEPGEEAVHKLRVATRRLIAKLFLLSAVIPGPAPNKARRLLKERLDALDELRDAHVLRLFFEGQTAAFPELILVRDALARLERRLVKPAARRITRLKSGKLQKWIVSMMRDLTAKSSSARMQRALQAAVLRAAEAAFKEVVQKRQAINPAEPQTIHRTRIAFKKFRYMVESLSPAVTGFSREQLRNLARYQRKMGAIQDLEVVLSCLDEYLERHSRARPLLGAFYRNVRGRRARAVRAFLKAADDLFGFWPPPGVCSR